MSRPLDYPHSSVALLDHPASPTVESYPPRQGGGHGQRANSTASSDYEYTGPGASQPSLPRYSSFGHSSDYTSAPGRPVGSPLNPRAQQVSQRGYIGPLSPGSPAQVPGIAHPLSNTFHAESDVPPPGEDAEKTSVSRGSSVQRNSGRKMGFFERTYRAFSGAAIGDSGVDDRHVKKKRLGYLDGMKFLAALVVLNGTLFDAVLTNDDYPVIQRKSPLYIVRSTNLGMVILLLLSGRCLIAPLWDAPNPNATGRNVDPRKPLISWPRLTRAMLVRPFRFIIPVLVVAGAQWGLASGGATKNCNAVGMNEPYWAQISNFAGYSTLVFDLFTYFEMDTVAGKAFGGNLWTAPWFFQSSYAVYVTHLMLGNLSSNRYWVCGVLMLFSWMTFNYFYVAIAGLFIADMAAHGQTARIRKWPVARRVIIWVILAAIALTTQWVPVVRDNLNKGMATISVDGHTEITFADSLFAIAFVFIVETCEVAQVIFGNIVMRSLGRLSAGIYLLAAPLTFTIVPDLALSMHNRGSTGSAIIGVSWAVLFGAALGLSIPFHFFIELPSKLAGEFFADFVEGFGGKKPNRRERAANVTQRTLASGKVQAGDAMTNKEAISVAVQNAGR